jgi:hypothetical protein
VQGRHEQRNQQTNLPLFNIEMMATRMTCESLKRGTGEVKSCFPFFSFQTLLFIFDFFILSNAKVSKNKYAVEKEKRKWWI